MGVPLEILSDRDNLITAEFFSALCDYLGIVQHTAIIYRPKGDGRAERAVRSVVEILRRTLTASRLQNDWVRVLPWCVFVQNSLPGVLAGYSPNQIVFGRELYLPGELPPIDESKKEVMGDEFFQNLSRLRQNVQAELNRQHEREKALFDSYHKNLTYSPGDRVWIKILPRDLEDKRIQKLRPLWMGPCEILEHITRGRYKVNTPKGIEELHCESFKPYRPGLTGKSLPFHYYQPSMAPGSAVEDWVVDKVLKHRKQKGKLQWLVLWKGYTTPTWEPLESFLSGIQDDWLKYNRKKGLDVSITSLAV
jgi:hypothetical protein